MIGKTLVFLLIFASLIYPASCLTNASDVILSEQGSMISIVIGLTVLLIAIAYMVGSFTSDVKYTIFAKDELYHLFFTVLLIVGFSGIVGFSCMIMDYFYESTFDKLIYSETGPQTQLQCYSNGLGLSATSDCYIKLVKGDAEQMAQQYLKQYIDNQMFATFSVTIQIPLFNAQTVSADSYRKVYSQQYDLVLNSFIVPALLSLNLQKMLLEFINSNVIQWILPIAFLFRVFFPTRQIGNFLIALSIGMYIIIPFMYTFNLAMYDIVSFDCATFASVTNDQVFGSGCSTYGFYNVGRIIPQAFFLPNLTIALFVTFMAAINKALRILG